MSKKEPINAMNASEKEELKQRKAAFKKAEKEKKLSLHLQTNKLNN